MFTKSVTGSGFAPQAYAYSIIPALYLKFYDIYSGTNPESLPFANSYLVSKY